MQGENTAHYFTELQRRLTKESIQTLPPAEDRLPIMLDSQEVGIVIPTGGMRYREGALDTDEAHDLFYRTAEIASEVRKYMNLMESAPPLKAQGVDEPYKLLVEFNGYVLGGVEGKYGIQFTTWMQDYDRNGVTLGHYFGSDYAGAKQDFAIRCGLISDNRLFTPEQLTEISQCCADALDTNCALSFEQEELLKGIQQQITKIVPDLDLRLQERSASMQQIIE